MNLMSSTLLLEDTKVAFDELQAEQSPGTDPLRFATAEPTPGPRSPILL